MKDAKQLRTDLLGIGAFISLNNLAVPKYQREYSWEEKHVAALIDDLYKAFADNEPEYFLGTIVVTEKDPRPEVVDGQQRLATISILLAAIRDHLKGASDTKRAALIESTYLFNQDLETLEIEARLELNEADNEFFEQSILKSAKLEPSKASNRRLAEAYRKTRQKVSENFAVDSVHFKQLTAFVSFVKEKAKVIVLRAPDEANAYILFETLNDRGLDLATSDLLKNYLFSKAGKKLEEVKERWIGMVGVLEANNADEHITGYIKHLWSSRNGLTREKELYSKIKEQIDAATKALEFTTSLRQNAPLYSALLNHGHEVWKKYSQGTADAIKILNLLNLAQPRPLLLAVLEKFSKKEVDKALPLIVNWSIRLTVSSKLGGGSLEKEYADLAKAISEGKIKTASDLSKKSTIIPNDKDFGNAFANLSLSKAPFARYLLLEIEKHLNTELPEFAPDADPENVNLEHVLPQTYTADWKRQFTEESHKENYRRLGNLTLLLNATNSSFKTQAFTEKVKEYKKSNLTITSDIAKTAVWNESAIDKRQAELAKLATKIWPNKV